MMPYFIEALHANCLEIPEDAEDVDSFVLRCLTCWCLEKNKKSPFKHDCSCPYYVSRGMCKNSLQHAIRNELIDLRPESHLKSSSKKSNLSRHKTVGKFLLLDY